MGEAWAAAKLMNSRAAEQQGPHCFQSATEATMKSCCDALLAAERQSCSAADGSSSSSSLLRACFELAMSKSLHFRTAPLSCMMKHVAVRPLAKCHLGSI